MTTDPKAQEFQDAWKKIHVLRSLLLKWARRHYGPQRLQSQGNKLAWELREDLEWSGNALTDEETAELIRVMSGGER